VKNYAKSLVVGIIKKIVVLFFEAVREAQDLKAVAIALLNGGSSRVV
jgi:hypothetical protein